MTVICTGAPASFSAAFKPPKPAPTITTRCAVCDAALPFILYSLRFHSIRFSAMAIGSENSAAAIRPAWVRWLMPSIAGLLFVAMLGVLVFRSLLTRLLGDAGIGWRIRTGQIILATHPVPRVDPFSSSMAGPAG